MSRRRRFDDHWYTPPPKQPVPADGIAAGRFGTTWWGREWIASLERLGRVWSNRLPRGRSYARAGRVVDLEIGAGVVTAGVVGSRPRPYRVELHLPPHSAAAWRRGLERLAQDTLLVIRLLGRELPDEVAERLEEAGVDLFPRRGELRTDCSCPDAANPCKHVAAVHYVLAAALDNDPFLLFRLRGLDREDLLAALGGGHGGAAPTPDSDPEEEGPSELEPAADLDADGFLGRDLTPPLPDGEPRPPAVELVGLKRLGPPPRGLERLPELLGPAVRAAGRFALELAWQEPDARPDRAGEAPSESAAAPADAAGDPGGGVDTAPRTSPAARLADRLVAVLAIAGRPMGRAELEHHVHDPSRRVAAALRALERQGRVVRHGRGPGTRYGPAGAAAGPVTPPSAAPRAPRRGRRPAPPKPPAASRAGREPRAEVPAPLLQAPHPPTMAQRVEDALAEVPGGLTKRELAALLGADRDELTAALDRLRRARVVATRGRAAGTRYLLAPAASIVPRADRDAAPGDRLAGRVVDLLGRSRTALPARLLAERLGLTTDELRPVLLALRQHGVVEMIGRRRAARYRLADRRR